MVNWLNKKWNIFLEDKTAFVFATIFAITQLSILAGLFYAFIKFYQIDDANVELIVLSQKETIMFPIAFLAIVVTPFITRWLLATYIFYPVYEWVKGKQKK